MVVLQLRLWAVDVRHERVYQLQYADETNGNNYHRYSTMDNIDGKQARRTGQSSGLGELFEYGSKTSSSKLLLTNL